MHKPMPKRPLSSAECLVLERLLDPSTTTAERATESLVGVPGSEAGSVTCCAGYGSGSRL